MSSFDDPFDPEIPLNREGCTCGHHKSQEEHDIEVAELQRQRQLQLEIVATREESRYGRAVDGALVPTLSFASARRRT
jgi:nitrate/nitrite transport system substrate-binding protein